MVSLVVQLAEPERTLIGDGSGYIVRTASWGHTAFLTIGNVSIAFDGRNNWHCPEGETFNGTVVELSEYLEDPVRKDNVSVWDGDSVAERIMFALADDLGYSVSRNPGSDAF